MKKMVLFIKVCVLAFILGRCSEQKSFSSISLPLGKEPQLFMEGVVSTNDDEFDINFTKNSDSLFFTRRSLDNPQKIYFSTWKNNKWTTPKKAQFSTARDEFPTLNPIGNILYFGSTRPIPDRPSKGTFDMNIWKVEKNGDQWSSPKPLGREINKIQDEKEQWPSSNENSIFQIDSENFIFSTMQSTDSIINIFTTNTKKDGFTSPKKVNGLFEPDVYWKSSPIISPDGKYLFFNAYDTPFGFGGEDIFVSKVLDKGFSKAVNLGKRINSKREETSPRFSGNGEFFFFSRNDLSPTNEDGNWNIYYLKTKDLKLENLFTNEEY